MSRIPRSDMTLIYLVLGIVLVPFGVAVYYADKYLANKQREFQGRGDWFTNAYWPIFGPRPGWDRCSSLQDWSSC